MKERPVRASVAAAVSARRERRERLDAAARAKWQFWRWRPKVSLCTFQILALFAGAIVLVYQRSTPWRAGYTLNCGKYPVNSIAFSGDSKALLTAGNDGCAKIWNADTGTVLQSFDTSKRMVAVGVQATPPKNPNLDNHIYEERDVSMRIVAADLSPDGKKAAVVYEDNQLVIFNLDDRSEVTNRNVRCGISGIHFAPDNQRLVLCEPTSPLRPNDGFIETYSLPNKGMDSSFFVLSDSLSSAVYSKDGNHIVIATSDGFVQVREASGKVVAALRGDVNFFRSAVFSPDGLYIATCGNDCTVRLWKSYAGDQPRSLVNFDLNKVPPNQDGGYTWYAKPQRILRGHNRYVVSSQFSPDGERLATVSLDGCVQVWGGRDGEQLFTLSKSGPWRSVAFAPHGKSLALAGIDGSVQLWNLRCSERWYGKLMLPEFWLMLLLLPALLWSIRRDQRALLGSGGVSAPTISSSAEDLRGTEAPSTTNEEPPEEQDGSTADTASN